ncbi:MAG: efflux transporter periplasmic adaptor subunit, partial [Xanthomonadales bacterium]|nr:efflux transporter periplasmic adaptor subunit [Xanthomonadales bacterium]
DVAERRSISIGSSSVDRVEILSGLAEGETIIVSGYDNFREYERVLLTD